MEEMLKEILEKVNSIDKELKEVKSELQEVKSDVSEMKHNQNTIIDRTAMLLEFRTETIEKFDILTKGQEKLFLNVDEIKLEQNRTTDFLQSVNEIIGRHTANFQTLKRKKIL